MKREFKNIFFICIIIYIIYVMFLQNSNEFFTAGEMNNYKNLLQINCDKNTKLYDSLTKKNKEKCTKKKGNTERETINNNTICYDDIAKEIVTKLDMESNCKLLEIVNKNTVVLPPVNKQLNNSSIIEGPDFINQWDTLTLDNKRANEYSTINLDNSFVANNKLATF